MADEARSKTIQDHLIGTRLANFYASFNSICHRGGIACTPDALNQLGTTDAQDLSFDLLSALRNLPAIRLLPSKTGRGVLRDDIVKLISAISSDDFNFHFHLHRIKYLLNAVLAGNSDEEFWDQVYDAVTVTESTTPPRPITSSLPQTPWLHNTSSFVNSSEYRKDVDRVLKLELGDLYVGLPRFRETFFGGVAGLETASEAVFKKCSEGSSPLFAQGWRGWPENANQDDVLSWFSGLSEELSALAKDYRPDQKPHRRVLAQPNISLEGSTAERKLDIGFVDALNPRKTSRYHWSQILVPGELKSNPSADTALKAWRDLGRYAREVLAAQDTRRFVLGFTICGSLMRIWEFDRLGGIASERFDINQDGLRFVSTVLGFLWMNEKELGFDPTITTENGRRVITIRRNGQTERLVVDTLMKRARCISGRATTCWKAYLEEDPQKPLVIKDSWQFTEREEEGELLQEATDKCVVNIARYYHHETVQAGGTDDDVQGNIRRGLDVTEAVNHRPRPEPSMSPPTAIVAGSFLKGRVSSTDNRKRSSGYTDAPLPPSKRSRSGSRMKAAGNPLPNRVYRRVILRDYGKPIYKASSRSALLAALEGCIGGHESLYKAGFLHRDISANNLMINEDGSNPSLPWFLIDLDLAIREQREGPSGAKGKTGTRAFMAIGLLLGEQHSFMHDLESFFWVLFWICIHSNGPDESRVVPEFDKWNYMDTKQLGTTKLGTVADELLFMKIITDSFTPYYEPLIRLLGELRTVVFPNGRQWRREDEKLYSRIRDTLRKKRLNWKS